MSLKAFAESELRRAGMFDDDSDYNGELGRSVLSLIEVLSEQGHSGGSASMAISILEKLAHYETLTPLMGDDDEWYDPCEGSAALQNTRCPRIFKSKASGEAYDIQGKIFREPSGACFTSKDSCVPVTFPYVPKREYVEVPAR